MSAINAVGRMLRRHKSKKYSRPVIAVQTPYFIGADIEATNPKIIVAASHRQEKFDYQLRLMGKTYRVNLLHYSDCYTHDGDCSDRYCESFIHLLLTWIAGRQNPELKLVGKMACRGVGRRQNDLRGEFVPCIPDSLTYLRLLIRWVVVHESGVPIRCPNRS